MCENVMFEPFLPQRAQSRAKKEMSSSELNDFVSVYGFSLRNFASFAVQDFKSANG